MYARKRNVIISVETINNEKEVIYEHYYTADGDYRDEFFVGDKSFFSSDSGADYIHNEGYPLPELEREDCISLFSDEPTPAMQTVLNEYGIAKSYIKHIILETEYIIPGSFHETTWEVISKDTK